MNKAHQSIQDYLAANRAALKAGGKVPRTVKKQPFGKIKTKAKK